MLFGNFTYSIDNKGRLVIPSKFRMSINDTLYAMRGYEKCLSLYPQASFDKLEADIAKLSFTQKASRDYMRVALSSTFQMTIDDHGRIQIPAATLRQYGLEGEVRIVGVNDHIEVWSEQAWTAYEEEADASFEATAASLKE